ncbi:putative transcription factor C2C2-GATA family [Helianthus annuus]|nr:putative transcription factor C2C2-GATA family [Helianthus annuus]KAJ0798940.1 putative transcription factor C2C2-GATA family [Helianthus annuus]KAJ0941684.1 putative transcription factor C2C2-GATA family [Helianthus annuus]KAJ0954243.1 putative transcription factor C2C2-GATA family [Helianthus annuus]
MASDLDSCLILPDDDLLNFTLDDAAAADHKPLSPYSNPNTLDSDDSSFPEFVEEELEWLSNKDAFPALDDIFTDPNKSVTVSVSVLDNNSSSSGNSNSHSHNSITSCCGSLRVPHNYPVRKRSNRRRKQRQCWWWNQVIEVPTSLPKQATSGGGGLGRRCQHCLAEKTPQWRAGPMGPKTLCNACGVRYKSGRLVAEYRPANSPTFSVALHSNSHRKIMEMRKKMQGG